MKDIITRKSTNRSVTPVCTCERFLNYKGTEYKLLFLGIKEQVRESLLGFSLTLDGVSIHNSVSSSWAEY